MPCTPFTLPDGAHGIVCSRSRKPRQRCQCGKPGTLLCDWKVPSRRSGTCDAPICSSCTTSPAPDKDLCLEHAAAWANWHARR